MFHPRRQYDRPAYTLIELLVVVVILITLVAIALPLARKVLDDSYTREASRQLNGYFAMAKINAVRTGRPWGLFMQCDAPAGLTAGTTPLRQITRLYLAEVQPHYAGGTLNSRAQISNVNNVGEFFPVAPATLPAFGQLDTAEMVYLGALIEPGETFVVRFDYKGESYRCIRGPAVAINPLFTDPTKFYYLGTLSGLGYPMPPGSSLSGTDYASCANYAQAKPFQILRGPRRVGNPLELTGGTCIDLTYCGIGPLSSGVDPKGDGTTLATPALITSGANNLCGFLPDNTPARLPLVQSVTVMFSPGGGVDEIYVNTSRCTPQGSVHFLIGRVTKVNLPMATTPADPQYGVNLFDPENSNLADPTALWVSVSHSTGTVTTAENIPPLLVTSAPPNLTYQYLQGGTNLTATLNTTQPTDIASYVGLCRQYAISHEQMGGR